MTGSLCAVIGCKNCRSKTKETNKQILYHSFPREEAYRNEWIQRCGRSRKINPNTSKICSEHFTEDDYKRDLVHELLELPLRKILKKTAIPTLNLPGWTSDSYITTKPDPGQQEVIIIKEENEESNINHNCTDSIQLNPISSQRNISSTIPETDSNILRNLLSPSSKKKSEKDSQNSNDLKYTVLVQRYKLLEDELKRVKFDNHRKIRKLNRQVKYYKEKYYQKPKEKKCYESAVALLKSVLTDNQIKILLKKNKIVKWTKEEISVAFTILNYSKECYLYLRNTLKYPLPGLSSLRKYASYLKIQKEISIDHLLLSDNDED